MKTFAESSRKRFKTLALVDFDPREFIPTELDPTKANYLLKGADVADNIFWQQALPDIALSSLLAQAGDDKELKEMILFHYGPYDRLNNNSPFLLVEPKVSGSGFYPRDLTREEFTDYIQNHPDCRPSFESPYTVIRRVSSSDLRAVPYHEAFHQQVVYLSDLLIKASANEQHPLFREFLARRAQDLLMDDYYPSESLWVGLSDNPIDLVIGPYEVYEDKLMGLKAAYEAMVLGRDFVESAKIQHFETELPFLCRSVEPGLGKSLNIEKSRVKLSVANLIYAGGDARKAIPATAFSLPNDERVIEEVGSRQVMLKNVLEAKFRLVAWPIHNHVLPAPLDDEETAFRHFLNHALLHEISHSIGPHRITKNGELTTVNRSLKQHYSVMEEARADTLAACFMLNICSELEVRTFLETYVSGFLRAVRFGVTNAHGGANAIQFNFLLQEGAIAVNNGPAGLSIDQGRARTALMKLASNIIDIQERGDLRAADRFVSMFCVMNSEINGLLERLSNLPIDIRIRYTANAYNG